MCVCSQWKNRNQAIIAFLATFVSISVGCIGAVQAQTAMDDAVMSQPRDGYDPQGVYASDLVFGVRRALGLIRQNQPPNDGLSTLLIMPRFDVSSFYDTNALRQPTHAKGDFAISTDASFEASTDHDDHGVSFGLLAGQSNYVKYNNQDAVRYRAHGEGFLAPDEDREVQMGASTGLVTVQPEEATSPSSANRPNTIFSSGTTLAGRYAGTDWWTEPNMRVTELIYMRNTPVVYSNEFDHREWYAQTPVYRTISEGSAVFIEPSVNARDYDRAVGLDSFHHNSWGFDVIAGIRLDFSSVTYAELGGGWMEQRYTDSHFPTVLAPTFTGKYAWNPTSLLSLAANMNRQTIESMISGYGGIQTTTFGLSADYEVDTNILLHATGHSVLANYIAPPYTPGISTLGIGFGSSIQYLVNDHLQFGASVLGFHRQSNSVSLVLDYQRFSLDCSVKW